MIDLDTAQHEDHVWDNVLTVGCRRCQPYIEGLDGWEEHRQRIMNPPRQPGDVVRNINGTGISARWTGHFWERIE